MKFGYIVIYVKDVPSTIEFYQRAFGLPLKYLHESNQYAELETGETALVFAAEELVESHGISFRPNRESEKAAGFEIALVAEDVEAAFKKAVKEGAKAIASPALKPWGQIVSYVADPNGVLVEICSPISE